MSEIIKSEAISRRRALSLFGKVAVVPVMASVAALTASDAEAQTVGMQRRQERRADGTRGATIGAQGAQSNARNGAQAPLPAQVQIPAQVRLPAQPSNVVRRVGISHRVARMRCPMTGSACPPPGARSVTEGGHGDRRAFARPTIPYSIANALETIATGLLSVAPRSVTRPKLMVRPRRTTRASASTSEAETARMKCVVWSTVVIGR